mmetsp:Transcript_53334/g.129653  ORF Transcript_53334/g.129653 Transcript_53334/m.129653 type:complete len:296 (-) Transcript_53334:875-1762(-)
MCWRISMTCFVIVDQTNPKYRTTPLEITILADVLRPLPVSGGDIMNLSLRNSYMSSPNCIFASRIKSPLSNLMKYDIYTILPRHVRFAAAAGSSKSLYPFPWVLACIDEFSFRCSLLWDVVVFPPCCLWKTHQDTFDTATGLQSEHSTTVVDQVEFDVSSSSHKLPFLLFLGEFIILVLLDDGAVRLGNRVQTFLAKFKDSVGITVILVVKEDSTKSTSFVTVLDNEVSVGPFLEFFVVVRIMLVANLLVRSVEMFHVILVDVTRGCFVLDCKRKAKMEKRQRIRLDRHCKNQPN